MGRGGPLKLPNHLKAVPDKADDQTVADVVRPVAPTKPPSIAENEKLSALWDEIVPQLEETGLVTPADGPTIVLMLQHYAVATEVFSQINGEYTMPDRAGATKRNPALVILNVHSDKFLEYAKALGMTWMARVRTAAPKADPSATANPFDGEAATG